MSVRKIEVEFDGGCRVTVDGKPTGAKVRVTYKRDGSLSTLHVGSVSGPLPDNSEGES